MTERNSLTDRDIPAGMSETTSDDNGAGTATRIASSVLGQAMAAVSGLLELEKGAVPHIFACALGVNIGAVAGDPEHGPDLLGFTDDDLEGFADKLATQVRENVILSAKMAQQRAQGGGADSPEILAAIREAAARGGVVH